MEKAPAMEFAFDQANNRLILTINGVACPLDTATVDQMIVGLGEARSAMQPPYTPDVPESARTVVDNPTWRTHAMPMMAGSVLNVRDPRFGWLSYYLAPESTARMGHSLVDLAATPASTTTPQ